MKININGITRDMTPEEAEYLQFSIPDQHSAENQAEFNTACAKFRACCNQIKEAANLPQFFGGYDEIDQVKTIDFNGKNELLLELLFLNQLCLHTAKKIGLEAPAWFYQCWGDKLSNYK